MSAVKSLMMDVEDFVHDFYTDTGEMTDTPKNIIQKAIDKFGYSFGSYAKDVIDQTEETHGGHFEFNSWVGN